MPMILKKGLKELLFRCSQYFPFPYAPSDRVNLASLNRFRRTHRHAANVERSWRNGLTVVVPCYNHSGYLDATFTCLAQQTFRPFDVIFVEDHSLDDTLTCLKRLVPQLPSGIRATILRTLKNAGQAFSINLAVESSRASIFMVLNDDDYLMHDAIEATLQILEYNSDLFLFGTTAIHFSGNGCPPGKDESKLIRKNSDAYTSIPLTRCAPANALEFRYPNDVNMTHSGITFFKSAWQAAGGYYSKRSRRVVAFADRDFQIRVISLFPAAVSMTVPFVYWRSDSSVDAGKYS